MVQYSSSSPYGNTEIFNDQYLDHFQIRPVPASASDVVYTIEAQYNHRPDLLAYDLYNNTKLWWVFAQRNMDVIRDPIYDFRSGVTIYIPQGPQIRKLLGS